ncbi:MAG: ABC transporter ATP-binding protein [Methylobacteriaceae bacterium]|nr:ABC transporter ATP-binding protein [Methylobacteriaceae bacterium]MBV9245989.1 ABC transporter ATP-binding protein [Methylobacteriaceae bacterium]
MNAGAREALTVSGLTVAYRSDAGWLPVVEEASFTVREGEVLGLAGESGCGKTTVAYAMLGERRPGSRIMAGTVLVESQDVLAMPERDLQLLRGARISMVPQNPATSLTPTMICGRQVMEVLEYHRIAAGAAARRRALELLEEVGLRDAPGAFAKYPHQMSGGQQQRVVIAMALAARPRVVVLDEPTTGLDVTTQWRILRLLRQLRDRFGTAMLYVSHDLAALAQICDRIAVMYAGRIVEVATTRVLFAAPRHPYTRALLAAVPSLDRPPEAEPALKGSLRRDELPPGCPFAPRCAFALPACAVTPQALVAIGVGHEAACWRWRELDGGLRALAHAD